MQTGHQGRGKQREREMLADTATGYVASLLVRNITTSVYVADEVLVVLSLCPVTPITVVANVCRIRRST